MTSVAYYPFLSPEEDFTYHPHQYSPSGFPVEIDPVYPQQTQPQNYFVPTDIARSLEVGWNRWLSLLYGDFFPQAAAARIQVMLSSEGSRVLDIGSGIQSLWISGVAQRFPNAACVGMDSVSEREDSQFPNLALHSFDWSLGLPYEDASFHLINQSFISWWLNSTYPYSSLVEEIGRSLAPGGVLLVSEPSHQLYLDDGTDLSARYPALSQFLSIHEEVATRRSSPLSHDFEGILLASGMFSQVLSRTVEAQVGRRGHDALADQAGEAALENIRMTYRAWMPLVAGYSEQQAWNLERRLEEELGWIESGAWGEGGGISGVVTCCIAVKSE
ncbi:hypothetical protein BDY24DRAFT_122408 [Mrakia frigida]|uniref:uncharacterized protein n=1 Tax=Mrakia frigida TaxID=29902 RepID=UPI003FCC1D42